MNITNLYLLLVDLPFSLVLRLVIKYNNLIINFKKSSYQKFIYFIILHMIIELSNFIIFYFSFFCLEIG